MDLFHTLTKNLVVKIDEKEYPNFIFFFNENNNCIFKYNTKNGYFYCSYYNFIIFFYEKFNINWLILNEIIKDMVENHFKLKGITPCICSFNSISPMENHFKLKGITSTTVGTKIDKLGRKPFQIEGNYIYNSRYKD